MAQISQNQGRIIWHMEIINFVIRSPGRRKSFGQINNPFFSQQHVFQQTGWAPASRVTACPGELAPNGIAHLISPQPYDSAWRVASAPILEAAALTEFQRRQVKPSPSLLVFAKAPSFCPP